MVEKIVSKTEEFLAREFEKNPHYSFNDGTVMRDHSLKVRDIALQIAADLPCDKTVVAVCALLHDIGKTFRADAETLHKRHEEFNWRVSETFLNSLDLPKEQLEKIKAIISHASDSVEMKIIEDADALALYADKRLYMLYIRWAKDNNLGDAARRKIDKFSKLNFAASKEIGEAWFEQMKKDWAL